MALVEFVDAWWPEPCAICDKPIITGRQGPFPLCAACIEALPGFREPRCTVCGAELISEASVCMRCRSRDFAFVGNSSLFPYRDKARTLVRAYKFDGVSSLARFFAAKVAESLRNSTSLIPVVPVPPRRGKHLRRRRVDQVERIARILEHVYSIPVVRALERTGGAAQKSLDYEGRMSNLTGKFIIRGDLSLEGDYALFDDVFTTGATANECARVLRVAGASSVRVVTIALD